MSFFDDLKTSLEEAVNIKNGGNISMKQNNSDTNRSAFEDTYWNKGIPSMIVGTRNAIFARKENGEYRLSHTEGAWIGWNLAKNK